jgi:hypothetical protein
MATKKTTKKSATKGTPGVKAAKPKPARQTKAARERVAARAKPKKVRALDAAAEVLATSGGPMRAQQLIDEMAKRGLWTSPGGKTPASTLYAAMTREISTKGADARFKKTDRGLFMANG